MALERVPLSPYLGLELRNIDLSRPIDAQTEKEILDAWIEAGVLLFRGLGKSDDIHMRLSRLFGELEPAATADLNNVDNPYLMTLAYDPRDSRARLQTHYELDGVVRAGWLGWHWDQSFMPTIVRGAVLRMVDPPTQMGETGFIDAIAAYKRLPDDLKKRIDGLEVVYEFNPDFVSGQFGFPKSLKKAQSQRPPDQRSPEKPGAPAGRPSGNRYNFPPCVHPLVITQYETGRKVLKLSPMHARYVLGMDRAQSNALLEELAQYLVDPVYAYYHRWAKDDMIVWDNWRVIHSANGVPLDCTRRVMRTTIMGDYKVGRYLDPASNRDQPVARIVD